ncbi:LptF/LptG family permease [Desulfurobacterium thermolithotrophum]|uniref:LptF/LptG family permease n=1 Tax=Desulfurobacterium thermolithotrophum TaxID=64160 RepID=UPI0013D2AA65|nr:LptF/LptG family permease [Desulfurobacterium thermolithotrophum]
MVKRLDRYVFIETLRYFVLTLLTFMVLFIVIDFVSKMDTFLKSGIADGFLYVIYRLPLYTVRVIPIATLIATMVTLSNFSFSNELTVVKALGISVYRFSFPIIFLAFLASILSFLIGELIVPKSISLSKSIYYKVKENKNFHVSGKSIWFKKDEKTFVFMEYVNPEKSETKRISILFLGKEFSPTKRIDALYGINVKDDIWKLKNCFERELKELKTTKISEKEINLGIGKKDLIFTQIETETMSSFLLYKVIKQLKRAGYDTTGYLVDLYSKLAISLLPLVVAVIGIPLGVFNPRNKKGYTLVIAAALIVFMWITISFFSSLGKSGVLPPFYSAFAPEVMFLSIGLLLLARMDT